MHHIMKEKTVLLFKLKRKKKISLLSQFYNSIFTDITGMYLSLYVGGEQGLLTASAVTLKYRRSNSLCWIYLIPPHPPHFLKFIRNYLTSGEVNYSSYNVPSGLDTRN